MISTRLSHLKGILWNPNGIFLMPIFLLQVGFQPRLSDFLSFFLKRPFIHSVKSRNVTFSKWHSILIHFDKIMNSICRSNIASSDKEMSLEFFYKWKEKKKIPFFFLIKWQVWDFGETFGKLWGMSMGQKEAPTIVTYPATCQSCLDLWFGLAHTVVLQLQIFHLWGPCPVPGGKQSQLSFRTLLLPVKGGWQRYTGLSPLLVTHMDAGPDENTQEAGISNLKAGPWSQIQLKTQTGFSQRQRSKCLHSFFVWTVYV